MLAQSNKLVGITRSQPVVAQAFTTARPRHQLAELYPAPVFHTHTYTHTYACTYFTWAGCIAFREIRGCASLAGAAVVPRVLCIARNPPPNARDPR